MVLYSPISTFIGGSNVQGMLLSHQQWRACGIITHPLLLLITRLLIKGGI
nr:MAG TPA: hypothetical protein [Caudoviricetes sp.]DAU83702.1 MAG TPA: hypothetical protein [Caudoviricetes sp.]